MKAIRTSHIDTAGGAIRECLGIAGSSFEHSIANYFLNVSDEEIAACYADGKLPKNYTRTRASGRMEVPEAVKKTYLHNLKEARQLQHEVDQAFAEFQKQTAKHGGFYYCEDAAWEKLQLRLGKVRERAKIFHESLAPCRNDSLFADTFRDSIAHRSIMDFDPAGSTAQQATEAIERINKLGVQAAEHTQPVTARIKDIIYDIEQRVQATGGGKIFGKHKHTAINLEGIDQAGRIALFDTLASGGLTLCDAAGVPIAAGIGANAIPNQLLIKDVLPDLVNARLNTFEHVLFDPMRGHIPLPTSRAILVPPQVPVVAPPVPKPVPGKPVPAAKKDVVAPTSPPPAPLIEPPQAIPITSRAPPTRPVAERVPAPVVNPPQATPLNSPAPPLRPVAEAVPIPVIEPPRVVPVAVPAVAASPAIATSSTSTLASYGGGGYSGSYSGGGGGSAHASPKLAAVENTVEKELAKTAEHTHGKASWLLWAGVAAATVAGVLAFNPFSEKLKRKGPAKDLPSSAIVQQPGNIYPTSHAMDEKSIPWVDRVTQKSPVPSVDLHR